MPYYKTYVIHEQHGSNKNFTKSLGFHSQSISTRVPYCKIYVIHEQHESNKNFNKRLRVSQSKHNKDKCHITRYKVHVQHGSDKNFSNLGFRFSQSWNISTSIHANHLMLKRRWEMAKDLQVQLCNLWSSLVHSSNVVHVPNYRCYFTIDWNTKGRMDMQNFPMHPPLQYGTLLW